MKPVRGYIFSRPFMGERVPQHVQNLVIRDYCTRNDLHYLLSATEYSMSGSQLILREILSKLPELHGIVAYSLFQLPEKTPEREHAIETVLRHNKTFYFALEGQRLTTVHDAERIEATWRIKKTLRTCLHNEVDIKRLTRC